ncbi:MAG: NAD-dependent DNA ligase LigA [Lachnospiraceae bacterium]|nr:NAD-dependent DNA ligase LigA [Lachnospiraceae bacterium]
MENSPTIARIKELTETLSAAARAYYAEDREIMSNYEYDKLYDELSLLEKETGFSLSNSPTQYVGYEAVLELPKERHEKPMLSLGKTKNREELKDWLKDKQGILSWKLDGLTVVLTYNDGKLAKAVTRGNGEIGEVVTGNARAFLDLPLTIPFKQELVLRGEAVITYSDFTQINEALPETEELYKNPRNLSSGSVRQLNNKVTAARMVRFFAFAIVKAAGKEFAFRKEQMSFLKAQGFLVVDFTLVDENNLNLIIGQYEEKVKSSDIPSDGLVISYDDIAYGESLGATAKFPRDSMAFKWEDEIRETTLLEIEWSPSRTGLINPVAIFAPVELEGTTISRASVHNISILKNLKLGIGDRISVYKANMIIPQIAENLTCSDSVIVPAKCPACGKETKIHSVSDVKSLYCFNPDCGVKKIKSFTLLVSRNALNIAGMSEATLEKFIGKGFIRTYADLFHLENYRQDIITMEGFGEKSYQNLIKSIDIARKTTLPRVIYGLGILNIGAANAKMLCREFDDDIERLRNATIEELSGIEGIGEVIAASLYDYFRAGKNSEELDKLLNELYIETAKTETTARNLDGLSFVITGSLNNFTRHELKEEIEKRGGKVTGSVSSKTKALINNDNASNSSKNKTAKELGIPVVTEDEFAGEYLG